jgi:hypothetical protein
MVMIFLGDWKEMEMVSNILFGKWKAFKDQTFNTQSNSKVSENGKVKKLI